MDKVTRDHRLQRQAAPGALPWAPHTAAVRGRGVLIACTGFWAYHIVRRQRMQSYRFVPGGSNSNQSAWDTAGRHQGGQEQAGRHRGLRTRASTQSYHPLGKILLHPVRAFVASGRARTQHP
jgi:hypothetical protein